MRLRGQHARRKLPSLRHADGPPAQQSAAQPSRARADLTVTRSPRAGQASASPDADILERLRGRRGKLGPISGSVLGFVLMAMLFGLCWQAGLETERSTARRASVASSAPASPPEPDLELLEHDSERGQFGELYITGRIRNNRRRSYSYAQVQISLYNEAGEQVGSTLANTNNLEPSGVWRFKAVVFQDDASKYRVGDISGW